MAGHWRKVQVDFYVIDDIEDKQVDRWLASEDAVDFPTYPVFWVDEIGDKSNA